jgi:DNA uptake protein ComE-like DNA-binding protein
MYRFEWSVLVTDALLAELAAAAGDSLPADDALRTAVARILAQTGGLPVVEQALSGDQRTALARGLLYEALLHATRDAARSSDSDDGYVAKPRAALPAAGEVARGVERVAVNSATAAQLQAIGLSRSVSTRIVEERQTRGRLGSLRELDERIAGIGQATIDEIAHAVRFDRPSVNGNRGFTPPTAPLGTATFAADMAHLVTEQPGDTGRARLMAALDLLATRAASDPHPATRQLRIRRPLPAVPADGTAVDWIGVLANTAYYARLPQLFDGAATAIDVCMFHIAAPDPGHPTYVLLEALVRAKARGVALRVLMDQDREQDPYLSTVINSPARMFLTANGVECRFDVTDTLLHSKFVLVDGTYSVVGSHNWSAGSYFQFDDLSVLVASSAFNQQMKARFEELWAGGV